MGLNLGDIIIDGDDIYGDGINIAARLEGLADPGGICISGSIFDQVHNKIDLSFQDLGEQEVKNIAHPVRVYRVRMADTDVTAPQQGEAPNYFKMKALAIVVLIVAIAGGVIGWQSWNTKGAAPLALNIRTITSGLPSIAVLPFNNLSGDKSQEYFADGMSEDLITDLSKISGLLVIARNSTFAYKGQQIDIRTVARELGVSYVVEGSVRKADGRVRITAQLINADSGLHIWADRYDRELNNIFALQDEVRQKIVEALKLKLTGTDERRLERQGTTNVVAYDL